MGLSRRDRAAMKLAIERACASDEGRAQQIDAKFKAEPFEKVGRFAAYCCQYDALGLKPWQWPPCLIDDMAAQLAAPDDGDLGKRDAALLLQRMQKLRVSKFDPDPMAALAEAEKRDAVA
jgi:hypothetical protein